jgi:periplasmic divalent cation tolerance protein
MITTCASETEAQRIAKTLVDETLAACVQLVPIQSVYRWQGEIHTDPEFQLIIKTRQDLYNQVENRIKELHQYYTPEIIALPIVAGSMEYLGWLGNQTKS